MSPDKTTVEGYAPIDNTPQITETTRQRLLVFQRNEITEHRVYTAFARQARGANRGLLERIAADELRHYEQFKTFTGCDVAPNGVKVAFYRLCARVFGFTFGIRLMERGEKHAQEAYRHFGESLPAMVQTMEEENRHERMLIDMIDEENLKYMGSMVLALNNSIQEFSGIAAGLTFAMQTSARAIGVTVLISGLAATLAMSASEYLSQKAEAEPAGEGKRKPWKAVFYAGGIYLFIVLTIVAPYFLIQDRHAALAVALCGVGLILTVFTFFMAVVQELRYRRVLLEALGVALAVVAASFLIGKAAQGAFHTAPH